MQKFKYVIIKYLTKYFTEDEYDKFSFFQFGANGNKTLSLKPCSLKEFCSKFSKTKNNVETANTVSKKIKLEISPLFMGLYDILNSIIKNYQTSGLSDNIIMVFMNSEDIRFSSIDDCINIVDELNKNNTSLYFFCFEEIIDEQKINNIQSFLNGLNEGNFFKIKKYQQIKEIFINISNNKHQSNFFKFDYDCYEHYL